MKVKIFDVVELKNGYKATIVQVNNTSFKADIIDNNGKSLGIKEIHTNEIKNIIYSK